MREDVREWCRNRDKQREIRGVEELESSNAVFLPHAGASALVWMRVCKLERVSELSLAIEKAAVEREQE